MSTPITDEPLYRFHNPVKLVSGRKALEHLPVELDNHDAVRPMVVAFKEQGLRGRLRRLIGAFRDSGMTLVVYDRLTVGADLERIRAVAGYFHEAGCDALLALGQGPLLHLVKALRLYIQTSALPDVSKGTRDAPPPTDGASSPRAAAQSDGGLPRPDPSEPTVRVPLFWLPTGPGAGDELEGDIEVSGQTMTHPSLRPQLVCIDRRLLDPSDKNRRDRERLLDSVLIALVNAVEVCLMQGDNPFAVAYAEAAIGSLVDTLTPDGLEASRGEMVLALTNAAVWAACARDMQPPGLAHRLGRALAVRLDLGAGILMALCLPAVVDRGLSGKPHRTAQLLHLLGDAELYSLSEPRLRRSKCVNLLREGWHTLCINWPEALPFDLQATGIAREALPEAARAADPADPQSALTILERSWTLIPPMQLQAQASTEAAQREKIPSPDSPTDEGAQDAAAELL
jgi:alcohol dehydrogenase